MKYPFAFTRIVRAVISMAMAGMLCAAVVGGQNAVAQPGQVQFSGPAVIGQLNVNSGVAATLFKGNNYEAWQSADGSCYYKIALLVKGLPSPLCIGPYQIADQPTLTTLNNTLYVAASELNTHQLIVGSSQDGINFSFNLLAGLYVAPGPAIAAFNNQLYVSYQENASAHRLGLAVSNDGGLSFSSQFLNYRIGHWPGMVAFNNKLVIAAFCQCDSHYLDVYTSTDGANFTFSEDRSQSLANASPPALAAYNNVLYISYIENGHRVLYTTTSYDGVVFSGPKNSNLSAYQGGGIVIFPPTSYSAASLYMFFRGPDGTRDLSFSTAAPVQ